MKEIHQVLVTAATGDAIFNDALAIRDLLRETTTSEIFALHRAPEISSEVHTLASYDESRGGDRNDGILIYHVGIGEPAVHSFLLARPEALVLVYHNISPAGYFEEFDPAFAERLRLGREELVALRPRTALALADSPFNARELEEMGFPDVRVQPLLLDLESLHGLKPTKSTIDRIRGLGRPAVLFVGQMLPHKRPDLLLQAFHVLTTFLRPEAALVMVGSSRTRPYAGALRTYARQLRLRRLWFTGPISREELAACFRACDVFVTMSEHEGFCVPILEAMAFDLPVIARGCTAVPETVGDAGIVLPPEPDPILAAETIAAVLDDARLRDDLVDRGRRRVKEFGLDAARAAFLDNISELI